MFLMRSAMSARHNRKYGEKASCPIPVWNGVLEHRDRIGHAIWEFLWCLDKITKETDGIGWVFGGAPVKISAIAADLREDEKTARLHLARLKKHGYIQRTRTPYGFVITVVNSLKFEIWHGRVGGKNVQSRSHRERQNPPICPAGLTDLSGKYPRNKEDAADDATVDAAVPLQPLKSGSPLWNLIGVHRESVPPQFAELSERLYANKNGQCLSEFMGVCMDGWSTMGEKEYPPEFARAKAKIKAREREKTPSAQGLPFLKPMPPLPLCKSN